jgi:hypothetical protein
LTGLSGKFVLFKVCIRTFFESVIPCRLFPSSKCKYEGYDNQRLSRHHSNRLGCHGWQLGQLAGKFDVYLTQGRGALFQNYLKSHWCKHVQEKFVINLFSNNSLIRLNQMNDVNANGRKITNTLFPV